MLNVSTLVLKNIITKPKRKKVYTETKETRKFCLK